MCRESQIDFSRYEIHEDGSIWSKRWNREIKGSKTPDGYLRVSLTTLSRKKGCYMWNRVIYYYFNGEIPDGLKVNHIDENKLNNSVENLNIMTHKENCNWGTRNKRISLALTGRKFGLRSDETKQRCSIAQKRRMENEAERAKLYKTIWQYDREYGLVAVYKSIKEASEKTGFAKSAISSASRGVLNRNGNHNLGNFLFYNKPQNNDASKL